MSFLPHIPPESPDSVDEQPGTMHIGGPRGKRLWHLARWLLALSVIAGLMVALFVRFGATTFWAFGLVFFMFGYMALMSRWAGR
jgi:hypothetical protein